jgi:hypothetical protein
MNNKTKIYLGLGVLAVATYYFWNKSKSTKANAAGKANVPCAFLEGSELVDGKTSTYDPNVCVSSSGRSGPVYSEHSQNWKSKI